MVSNFVITSVVVALIAVALGGAYVSGALDPVMEEVAKYLMKLKGKAEEKKLEAQGLKEGQDFIASNLKGNQQAESIANQGLSGLSGGIGSVSDGLKI